MKNLSTQRKFEREKRRIVWWTIKKRDVIKKSFNSVRNWERKPILCIKEITEARALALGW